MECLLEEIDGYIDSWLNEQRRQFWILRITDRIRDVKIGYGDMDRCLIIEWEHGNKRIIYNIWDSNRKECIIKKI